VNEYSEAFKANMVKKLLMPGAPTATALSAKTGIAQSTLSRWVRDAKDRGNRCVSQRPALGGRPPSRWWR
jgi:transposase-like protein